jgi:hypothetical protein
MRTCTTTVSMGLTEYGNDSTGVFSNSNNISPRRLKLGAPAAAAARDSLPDSILAFHSLGSIIAHVLDLALVSTQHHHRHMLNSRFDSECTAAVRSSTAQSHPVANLHLGHPPLGTNLKAANDSLVDLCTWRE